MRQGFMQQDFKINRVMLGGFGIVLALVGIAAVTAHQRGKEHESKDLGNKALKDSP